MASRADTGVRVRTRTPSPVRRAFTLAVQDWWYGLIPFAAINIAWLFLVVTVVAGPPATAAMLGVARDAAVGEGAEPKNFFIYLRLYFWRAWGLGLLSLLGTVILATDLRFYASLNVSTIFLFYLLVVWLEFLLISWPMMVNRPEMPLGQVVRRAALLTLRQPGANLGIALVVLFGGPRRADRPRARGLCGPTRAALSPYPVAGAGRIPAPPRRRCGSARRTRTTSCMTVTFLCPYTQAS